MKYGIIIGTPKAKSLKHLALVGKGIVFDTGGHSLKQSAYMLGMHGDMAGSAVALGVLNVASSTNNIPSAFISLTDVETSTTSETGFIKNYP